MKFSPSKMLSVKACRHYGDISGMVFILLAGIFLGSVFTTQGAMPVYLVSETCYGSGNCSLHTLSCEGEARLAILEATYGFQHESVKNACVNADIHQCPEQCCSYNSSTDCKQQFTANNMENVQSECSQSQSCHIRAQWGDRWTCSSPMAQTSTYSTLKAVCIPEAVTIDPCSNATVTGNLVSLNYTYPPAADNCSCRIDTNTTVNNPSNVQILTYDLQASVGGGRVIEVVDAVGAEKLRYMDPSEVFPTTSITSPVTSLPLFATFSFDNMTASPARIWLGFQEEASPLTLRCGQDAVDYTMSLTTTTTTITTTSAVTTTTSVELPTSSSSDRTDEAEVISQASTESSDVRETTTAGSGTEASNQTPVSSNQTDGGPQKEGNGERQSGTKAEGDDDIAATDIIVYVAVGVSVLVVCAFLYVCIRKIRKKGCPSWCPAPCRDMDCGKPSDNDQTDGGDSDQSGSNNNTTTDKSLENKGDAVVTVTDVDESEANGSVGNGHVIYVNVDDMTNGTPSAFTQRRCSFEHLKRHRGSMQSLRRASFSNLENIKETEEDDEEGKSRGNNDHNSKPRPNHDQHTILNLEADQEEIIKCVDEHIASLENGDNDNNDDVFSNGGSTKADENNIQKEIEHKAGQNRTLSRDDEATEKCRGNEGQTTGRTAVVFRLGGGSESSDPDLETYFTKL